MIDISFEIKGKKIKPENMADVLDILFLKHVREKINASVASIDCKNHDSELSVIVKGPNLDNLNYEVSGCCENIVDKVKKKLHKY